MSDLYLHFTAGSGPRECRWVLARAAQTFLQAAEGEGLRATVLGDGMGDGPNDGDAADSLLVRLVGEQVDAFASGWLGTIRWIGTSPFRPHHRRKNWYVSVQKATTPDDVPDLKESDIRYQAMRARGPGGQHVNTTDSAVRATNTPTGLSVVAMEERSQHANRKLARVKLATILQERQEAAGSRARTDSWRRNRQLERGNEVKTFKGPAFKER